MNKTDPRGRQKEHAGQKRCEKRDETRLEVEVQYGQKTEEEKWKEERRRQEEESPVGDDRS